MPPIVSRIQKEPRVRVDDRLSGNVAAYDLVARQRLTYSTQGPSATRVFLVDGLTGPAITRLAAAIELPGIPKYGDNHPAVDYLPVSSISAEPAEGNNEQAYVTVEYGWIGTGEVAPLPETPVVADIEIVSTVHGTTTNREIVVDPVTMQEVYQEIVTWYFDDPPEGEPGPGAPRKQYGEVEYQQPAHSVVFRRKEPYSPGDAWPGYRSAAVAYVGRTNDREYLGETLADTWLCTRMDGASSDGGRSYDVTYEFQWRPPMTSTIGGWTAHVVSTNPSDGQRLAPVYGGVNPTAKFCRVYKRANFSELMLY